METKFTDKEKHRVLKWICVISIRVFQYAKRTSHVLKELFTEQMNSIVKSKGRGHW